MISVYLSDEYILDIVLFLPRLILAKSLCLVNRQFFRICSPSMYAYGMRTIKELVLEFQQPEMPIFSSLNEEEAASNVLYGLGISDVRFNEATGQYEYIERPLPEGDYDYCGTVTFLGSLFGASNFRRQSFRRVTQGCMEKKAIYKFAVKPPPNIIGLKQISIKCPEAAASAAAVEDSANCSSLSNNNQQPNNCNFLNNAQFMEFFDFYKEFLLNWRRSRTSRISAVAAGIPANANDMKHCSISFQKNWHFVVLNNSVHFWVHWLESLLLEETFLVVHFYYCPSNETEAKTVKLTASKFLSIPTVLQKCNDIEITYNGYNSFCAEEFLNWLIFPKSSNEHRELLIVCDGPFFDESMIALSTTTQCSASTNGESEDPNRKGFQLASFIALIRKQFQSDKIRRQFTVEIMSAELSHSNTHIENFTLINTFTDEMLEIGPQTYFPTNCVLRRFPSKEREKFEREINLHEDGTCIANDDFVFKADIIYTFIGVE